MLASICVMAMVSSLQQPVELLGADVGIRVRHENGEFVEELLARDKVGNFRVVLMSPTHPKLAGVRRGPTPTAVQGLAKNLFSEAPTFAFGYFKWVKDNGDTLVTFGRVDDDIQVEKAVRIPAKGNLVKVHLEVEFKKRQAKISSLLASYAFAPDGKKMASYGRPDSTYSPGLRPRDDAVVGDHFFRAPMISAQKGGLAALLMPDLDVLSENRPIPTIIDLDCKNGVADAPLMSYGFADHRVTGHVYFGHDESMTRAVPPKLELAFDLMLLAEAKPYGAYREAVPYQWERYGRTYFDRVLPQAMSFEDYANVCYPAALNEAYGANKLGWFEHEINGVVCGGIPAGWGFTEGWVSWQCWFNNLRSAWGMRWWGKRMGSKDLVDKADKMLNLALAAPMDRGAAPTTYLSRTKEWKGTLISPDKSCYYDLTNMAWKGIWMLRFLDFQDCPRKEEILRQCREMADLMVRMQNSDGSIPTWLTKDHKVVPILDHSAQTGLPAWFLAEFVRVAGDEHTRDIEALERAPQEPTEALKKKIAALQAELQYLKSLVSAQLKACDFLVKEVVDGQYYYDFETFFSCSPKQCFQRDGKVDHEAMRDPHTLQAPQNTLCMQWIAEALFAGSELQEQWTPLHGKPIPGLPKEAAMMKALDIMTLYQNVWPISYRKTAYTFGGFGVQNSDGEYLDARQAQFGCTLADFGAKTGRRDYFERGVAAVRASMTLINHPLHEQLKLYPKPNYPLGLQPENCGHGGVDHQNGRTGFDWGEGSGLTSMAWLLHKYGGAYINEARGWAVGIDGVVAGKEGRDIRQLAGGKTHAVEVVSISGKREMRASVPWAPRAMGEAFVAVNMEKPGLIITQSLWPVLRDSGQEGSFVTSSGKRIKAKVGTFGASESSGAANAELEPADLYGPIHFEGIVDGWPIKTAPVRFFVDPVFNLTHFARDGWTVQGDFAETPTWSDRMDFGMGGEPFIGTCENGRGGFDDSFTGTITSPYFLVSKPKIKLMVGGGAGEGVYVELISVSGSPPGGENANVERIAIARGKNRERMEEVVWDVSKYRDHNLQIRIVDREKGGWGHINVGRIRCE